MPILSYIFYPNPGNVTYSSPTQLTLLILSLLLIAGSFVLRGWRARQQNPITRKLSRSWSSAALWFGIIGVVLVVSRVEGIQFLAMRFTWALWVLAAAAYIFLQFRLFRAKHYEVLPSVRVEDPMAKYLPGKKRR